MTVEIGLTPDSRWTISIPELVAAASSAGFTGLGVSAGQADAGCTAALAAGGLRCHELLALVVTRNSESVLRKAHELASSAAIVGAPWVLGVFAVPLNTETAPIARRCAQILADAGARLAVEFSPLGGVPSLPAALEVVQAAGIDRAGVMIDTWHFFRGPSTWTDLEHVPLEQIAYVQFADAPEPVSPDGMAETLNRRVLPGTGLFALERFAATLLDRGWAGMVSAEVLSSELSQLPVTDFAARAYRATGRYWLLSPSHLHFSLHPRLHFQRRVSIPTRDSYTQCDRSVAKRIGTER
jgi:sugar phosphate isomerase/epimerase